MNMAKKTNERTGTLSFKDKLWAAAVFLYAGF
jgi:hypothetical protein